MSALGDTGLTKPRGWGSKRLRVTFSVILVPVVLVVIAAVMLPTLDVNKRQRVNQAMAVGRLETIIKLQHKFAATHPATGYSCQLPPLRSSTPPKNGYDPEAFLESGQQSGYRFVVVACRAESSGVVIHYQAMAVPTKATDSGFRYAAFCTDDFGIIRYDAGGSGENCLAEGKAIGC